MIFCGPNFYYVIFSGQSATFSLDREKKNKGNTTSFTCSGKNGF